MTAVLVANHDWSRSRGFIRYQCDGCNDQKRIVENNVTEDGIVHHTCLCGLDYPMQLVGFLRLRPVAQGAA